MSQNHHAIIFGASGVGGWSIVDQLLRNYPSIGTFSHVTAVVNRPLSLSTAHWPPSGPSTPTFQLISGIDLSSGSPSSLAASLQSALSSPDTISHAFFWTYKPDLSDPIREARTNTAMIARGVAALELLSPSSLRMVLFAGGAKAYGIHTGTPICASPFAEAELERQRPNMDPAQRDAVHYFATEDMLRERSDGKSWSWCELHFDAVIGFAPHGSAFSLAAFWGTYLSLYRAVNGAGAKVRFPGTKRAYASLNNEAGADTIARMAVWCALNADKAGGQVFNIADCKEPIDNAARWPRLARYFGLEGVAPDDSEDVPKPSEFIEKHKSILTENGVRANEVYGGAWLDGYGVHFDFDRATNISKAREAGFVEERDPVMAWYATWDLFKQAGMLLRQ